MTFGNSKFILQIIDQALIEESHREELVFRMQIVYISVSILRGANPFHVVQFLSKVFPLLALPKIPSSIDLCNMLLFMFESSSFPINGIEDNH